MKICPSPSCPDVRSAYRAEYRDDIETCPVCGSALRLAPEAESAPVESAPEPEDLEPAPEMVDDFVLTVAIRNAALVPLAKSLLLSASISFRTRNEIEHSSDWSTARGDIEFWVRSADRGAAIELLAELLEYDPDPRDEKDEERE